MNNTEKLALFETALRATAKPTRKDSIINRDNWDAAEQWYRVGNRIAWYDRYIRLWTTYNVDIHGYQDGAAQYGTLADMIAGTYQ